MKREEFEQAARLRRASSTGDFLRRLQEQRTTPSVTPVDLDKGLPPPKRCKGAKVPTMQVQRPVFPMRAMLTEREDRRRDVVHTLRAHSEARGTQVAAAAGSNVDLCDES